MATLSRCEYIIPRKKRNCRMQTKSGKRFCGEHSFGPENDTSTRVPCPLDPKHTVEKERLEKHLRKCNSKLPVEEWVVENMNIAGGSSLLDTMKSESKTKVTKELIEKVESFQPAYIDSVEEGSHSIITDFVKANADLGPEKLKHLTQQSSILGHMDAVGLFPPSEKKICYAELGAGKAQLGSWLAQVIPANNTLLLVDHSGSRNKFENKVLKNEQKYSFERIRCGVQHLDLSQVPALKTSDHKSVIAFWKHLCGSATDIGIRCLLNAAEKGTEIYGIALVPCCHHKSSWAEYVGKEFLLEKGFAETDYSALKTLCSWAVCGLNAETSKFQGKTASSEISLDPDKMEELGIKAKYILQLGRAEFLRKSLNYDISVVQFVSKSVTPENLLIIGSKKPL